MSILSNFLKGGKNPADAAMPYISQIPGVAHQAFDPYIQQGQQAYGTLNPIFEQMSADPSGFLNRLLESYEPSKSYQLRRDEALRAAGNTAAAGGTRGSIQDIEGETSLTDRLLGEDMQSWLNNVLGIQGRGLQGESGFYQTGFESAKGLESDLANALAQQGNLAFQGQSEKNRRSSDLFSSVLQGLGGIAGLGIPGGGTLGGKAIGKVAGWL